MCVIASKPIGIDLPTEEQFSNMWNQNPDGAGMMYAVNGEVHIEKGFMKYKKFKKRLAELADMYDLKATAMVFHFRITTHGGTKPENTHPFPITDSIGMLQKTTAKCKLGVAHNGIIRVTPRKPEISDTMEYIAGQLAPLSRAMPDFYRDKNILEMIENATESKLAFLDGNGIITTVGNFTECDGIRYSNSSYLGYRYKTSKYYESLYDWDNYSIYDDRYEGCSYKSRSLPAWKEMEDEHEFRVIEVMWLDEAQGEYVVDLEDNMMIDDYFAIDEEGRVYNFDWDNEDGTFLIPAPDTYEARTAEGRPLRFWPGSRLITEETVCIL